MAILCGSELIDWHIKSFKETWSEKKKERILDMIDRMLKRYDIDAIAIKVPALVERHSKVLELYTLINLLAQSKLLRTETITIDQLKEFCGEDVTNKDGLQAIALGFFPELLHECSRAKKSRNPYHTKLFEAALAARFIKIA